MAGVDAGAIERLRKLQAELVAEAEELDRAASDLRAKVGRLDQELIAMFGEMPGTPGSARKAGKRLARFYWAVYIAGGSPSGDFVDENQVGAALRKLSIDNKRETVAQLRDAIERRKDQHYEMSGARYRLKPDAFEAMEEERSKIEGIPSNVSLEID